MLTGDGSVRGYHVLEVRCARGSTDDGGAEEAVGRPRELLRDVIAQQLEITHMSGDTVTVAPCCAGRVRLNDRRSRVWGREGSLRLECRKRRCTWTRVSMLLFVRCGRSRRSRRRSRRKRMRSMANVERRIRVPSASREVIGTLAKRSWTGMASGCSFSGIFAPTKRRTRTRTRHAIEEEAVGETARTVKEFVRQRTGKVSHKIGAFASR